ATPRLRPCRARARRLPAAQQRRGAPSDRVGDHPQRAGHRQPRAALVLHHLVGAATGRAVHLGRLQGLAAQRRRHGGVRRQPVPGGAGRAGQPHRHGLPRGRQRVRRDRPEPRAQRAGGPAPGGGVAGRPGVPARRDEGLRRRLHRGVRRGRLDRRRRARPARRPARDLPAQAAGPSRGGRVEHHRSGQLAAARAVRRAEPAGV
ncbi:MAG: Nitrilotriacetate monooxygenase component B, partial [uncultured Frankineae bacterium]